MHTSGGYPVHSGTDTHTLTAEEKQLGQQLQDQYEIIRKLGSGGMGSVFQARNVKLETVVAIKVVSDVFADAQAIKRLKTEAQALASISHPNIVGVLNLLQVSDSQLALVMEYIEGSDLGSVIEHSGALRPERVRRLFTQAAEALVAAHARGIIHRDLKPSNLLVTADGAKERIKILDFGIAKLADGSNQKLTKTGMIVGSPAYMSPEQACGSRCDATSDIYSLGCVFYQALTGTPPFEGETAFEVLLKHSQEDIPRLDIADQSLASIIAKCTQRDPSERFQSAQELLDALNALTFNYAPAVEKAQTGRLAASATTPTHTKTRAIVSGAVVAILGAAAYFGYSSWEHEHRSAAHAELSAGLDVGPRAHLVLERLNRGKTKGEPILKTDMADLQRYDYSFKKAIDLRECANVYYEYKMPERGLPFRIRSVQQDHVENAHIDWEVQKLAIDALIAGDAAGGEKFLRDELQYELAHKPTSPVYISKAHWNLMCFAYLNHDKKLMDEMHAALKKEMRTPDAANAIQRWMTGDDALYSQVMRTSPKFGIDLLYV